MHTTLIIPRSHFGATIAHCVPINAEVKLSNFGSSGQCLLFFFYSFDSPKEYDIENVHTKALKILRIWYRKCCSHNFENLVEKMFIPKLSKIDIQH